MLVTTVTLLSPMEIPVNSGDMLIGEGLMASEKRSLTCGLRGRGVSKTDIYIHQKPCVLPTWPHDALLPFLA